MAHLKYAVSLSLSRLSSYSGTADGSRAVKIAELGGGIDIFFFQVGCQNYSSRVTVVFVKTYISVRETLKSQ